MIRVSSNLLPMLGARPSLGRLFLPEDDVPGRAGTAVLGHGTWTRRFGADPNVIGRAITLNGQPYTVVGVLPASFSLPREVLPTLGRAEDAEVLLPLALGPEDATVRHGEDYNLLATLKPGATVQQAQGEMDAITRRLREGFPEFYPANGGLTFAVVPLHETWSARFGMRSSSWSRPWASSCWWPASTSPTCCWRAPSAGSASWRCARPSAPAGGGWRGRC